MVCKQLGFRLARLTSIQPIATGILFLRICWVSFENYKFIILGIFWFITNLGSSIFSYDDVDCKGSERKLDQCKHSSKVDCSSSMGIEMYCINYNVDDPTTSTSTNAPTTWTTEPAGSKNFPLCKNLNVIFLF